MARKRREIIIETERTLLITSRSSESILWCEPCARRVLMLTPDEAAALMRVSLDEIFRRVDAGQLHGRRAPGGRLRICPNSLLR